MYHKGVIGIYHTQIQPSDQDFVALSSQWLDRLDIAAYQESRHGFLLANCDLCMVKWWMYMSDLNFYFLVVTDGLGVRRDYKMAIKFFNLASQTGT